MYFTNIFCRQGKRVGFQKDPKRVADWERSCAEGLRTRVGEKDAIIRGSTSTIRGRPVWECRLGDSTTMGDCLLVRESTLGDLFLLPLRTGEPFAGIFTYKQLFNTNKGPCQIKKLQGHNFEQMNDLLWEVERKLDYHFHLLFLGWKKCMGSMKYEAKFGPTCILYTTCARRVIEVKCCVVIEHSCTVVHCWCGPLRPLWASGAKRSSHPSLANFDPAATQTDLWGPFVLGLKQHLD